jgi:superfamily I DNA/RNA helicase
LAKEIVEKIKLNKKQIDKLGKAIAMIFNAKTLTDEQKEKEIISQLTEVVEYQKWKKERAKISA